MYILSHLIFFSFQDAFLIESEYFGYLIILIQLSS